MLHSTQAPSVLQWVRPLMPAQSPSTTQIEHEPSTLQCGVAGSRVSHSGLLAQARQAVAAQIGVVMPQCEEFRHCTQAPPTVSQCVRLVKPLQSVSIAHLSQEPSPRHFGVMALRVSHSVLVMQAWQSPFMLSQIGRFVEMLHCVEALHWLHAPIMPPAVWQTGVLMLRLSHSGLVAQAWQSPFTVSQIGRVAATVHCVEVLQTTQAPAMPPAVTQTGVLGFLLSHSPLSPQARHDMVPLSQTGETAPAQVEELTQPTQPVPARHCGLPAMCVQSLPAKHSTQVRLVASQREVAEAVQLRLVKQPTQVLVAALQNGVVPPQ